MAKGLTNLEDGAITQPSIDVGGIFSLVRLAVCAFFFTVRSLISMNISLSSGALFSRKLLLGYGWLVVLDDYNIVVSQEDDSFFDEVAQEERPTDPQFHHDGVVVCALTERGCSDTRSMHKLPM